MALQTRKLAILSTITALPFMSFSSLESARDTGIATFYTPPYACKHRSNLNKGKACGQMYQVTCPSGTNSGMPYPSRDSRTAEVKIANHCPDGCRGTIDLSQEAFASIADPDSCTINISNQHNGKGGPCSACINNKDGARKQLE
ncbi:RlpA-like protein, double-psi beta-barrel domain [Dillenia turbinata]|uniref:RlpA-like protein, double-psi beta-barrel domain n=1 Tax=Dillenia turbinata TaxID=194707 RepID=A0AAN8V554_9MAGN